MAKKTAPQLSSERKQLLRKLSAKAAKQVEKAARQAAAQASGVTAASGFVYVIGADGTLKPRKTHIAAAASANAIAKVLGIGPKALMSASKRVRLTAEGRPKIV